MVRRIAGYVFIGSLFAVLVVWGYLPSLWRLEWFPYALLGLTIVSLVAWTIFSLDKIILWLKQRSTQFGLSLAITALMAVAILTTVNWLAATNNKKLDLTVNKLHTLSDQSQKVVRELKDKVTIRVWTTSVERMSANLDARKFFENYKTASNGKVEVEIKNPNDDSIGAKTDKVKRDNLILVKSASGREARIENFTDTKGEEQVTNAIIQTQKGGKKTVCFLAGHGEFSINTPGQDGMSIIKDRLTESSYNAKEITLATSSEGLPKDCEALVIPGPQGDLSERESVTIRTFLTTGGKVLGLFGPATPAGWKKLVAEFGVEVNPDMIIDKNNRPPVVIATKNFAQDVDITKSFNRVVVLPETSSLKVPTVSTFNGANIKTFISSESWNYAKTGDLKNMKDIEQKGSDKTGPLPIAVLITKPIEAAGKDPSIPDLKNAPAKAPKAGHGYIPSLINEARAQDDDEDPHAGMGMDGAPPPPSKDGPKIQKTEMNFIVIGNNTFAINAFVNQVGNMDLFLNSVSYLMKDQDVIGIRPREIRQATLNLTNEGLRKVYATILLMSLAFLLGGIASVARKRKVLEEPGAAV